MSNFISIKIDGDNEEGTHRKRVQVFCLTNEDENKAYEALMNDPEKNIIEETQPTLDKVGRVIVVVKWEEPLQKSF